MIFKGDVGMEINDIKIFIELYHNKSISKTAEKLNYTQSNISTRLIKLEKEFHKPFFKRTKKGLEILPSAERFYQYALQISLTYDKLFAEFSIENDHIDIASTQLLSRLYFPSLYRKNSNLNLHTGAINRIIRDYGNNIYDIIITHTQIISEQNVSSYNKTEVLCWIQSKSFIDALEEKPSIILSRDKYCPLRKFSLEAITKYNLTMPILEVDTLDLMFSLLHTTNSIALLPLKFIQNDNSLLKYAKLNPESLDIFFYCNNETHIKLMEELFY